MITPPAIGVGGIYIRKRTFTSQILPCLLEVFILSMEMGDFLLEVYVMYKENFPVELIS